MIVLERVKAREPKFAETILIVSNFNGKIKNFQLHARILSDMGFNVAILELKHASTFSIVTLPIGKTGELGMRHKWADQIEEALNVIDAPVILFSFSHPSCAALETLYRRRARNLTAWITDGGPFLDVLSCYGNLLKYYYKVKFLPLRLVASIGIIYLLIGPKYEADLHKYLDSLPQGFPILSIKTWKDKLVPPSAIEKVFHPHNNLNLQSLVIPDAGHLEGLMKDSINYVGSIQRFLSKHAAPNGQA